MQKKKSEDFMAKIVDQMKMKYSRKVDLEKL